MWSYQCSLYIGNPSDFRVNGVVGEVIFIFSLSFCDLRGRHLRDVLDVYVLVAYLSTTKGNCGCRSLDFHRLAFGNKPDPQSAT